MFSYIKCFHIKSVNYFIKMIKNSFYYSSFIHCFNHIKQNRKRVETSGMFIKINKTIKTLNLCNFIILYFI